MNSVATKKRKNPMDSPVFRSNIESRIRQLFSKIKVHNSTGSMLVATYWPSGTNTGDRVYTDFSKEQLEDCILKFNSESDTVTIKIRFDEYDDGNSKKCDKACLYVCII